MPLHKTRPLARKACGNRGIEFAPGSGLSSPTSTDKSSEAARMAQQLGSESSWADTYVPPTPVSVATPAESVADTQSQLDAAEAPPSYQDAWRESELPSIPQSRSESVRQIPSSSIGLCSYTGRDLEAANNTPLLYKHDVVVEGRKQKQKRFFIILFIIAIWLIGFQVIKGFDSGFRHGESIQIPPFPQRNYTQHETSSSITGTFTFYDGLDLSTLSGSINIVIDPRPSDKVGVIRLSSRSGSIKVKFADEYIRQLTKSGTFDRVYDIEIRTQSGSHQLEMPQGNGGLTSLESESGSITAKLFTAALTKGVNPTTLVTQSQSGSQTIKIRPVSSDPITSLAAKTYVKGSGSIRLSLPDSWQGMVHASSGGSGSVDVKGDNLQYQRNGGKETYAWRIANDHDKQPGQENQVIEVRGDNSGSIRVDCSAS